MLMRYEISCRIRVNARDSWNTSCWHHSLSLFFSFTESNVDQVWREPWFDVRGIRSRGKGLSTFKKSPIHFCNHRAYDQQRSGAHSWSSWPRQACTRVIIFYSPAMAFLTVTYIAPLHDDLRYYRDLECFWIADCTKSSRIFATATMTKSIWWQWVI